MSVSNELFEKVIAWGRFNGVIYVAELGALERIGELHGLANDVLSCDSWATVKEVIDGAHLEKHLGYVLDDLWHSYLDEEEIEFRERPAGWLPEDTNFAAPHNYELIWSTEKIYHQDSLNLPEEFFEFGVGGGNVMVGDTWRWSESDLPQLAELAQRLGYSFEERQDLIDKCIG